MLKNFQKKIGDRALWCILLSYHGAGCRLVNGKDERITFSRDVTFDKTQLHGKVRGGGVVVLRGDDAFGAPPGERGQDSAEIGEGGTLQ